MVDLRNNPIADRLKDQCTHNLAQGDEGSCEIEVLDQEGTQLTYKVAVRSRQITKVHIPFDGDKTIVVYDATVDFQGTIDIANPTSWGSQQICVDTPVGKQCMALHDLIDLTVL